MASTKNLQEEAMASIDTAKALIDKVLSIMELILVSPSLSLTFSINPIGFLLQILKHLGITYEEIRQWLINFLIYIVPILEISVKTILLTNLKNMISCSIDPRIPEKYRKRHKADGDWNSAQEYGIDINIESIDFLDKLSTSPLSDYGNELYFGLEGVNDSYKFARAEDFDAFLWFVIHKGKFPNSTFIKDSVASELATTFGTSSITPEGGSLLGELKLNHDSDNPSSILLGNTFAYSPKTHVISICIDRKMDQENNITENTIVPVSDDWTSVNWYTRRGDYLKNLVGINKSKSRDYSKERAICNLQYIDQASSDAPLTGLVNNKLRFTILPRPYIHIPNLASGEPPFRFKKMLFNEKGEYDKNGKYTFATCIIEKIEGNDTVVFEIPEICGDESGTPVAKMNLKSGEVTVTNKDELIKNLMECYPGLTVFEFNFDYVMSLKLFDAKVMATTLLDSLIDTKLGINIGLKPSHQEATETIKEILKSIIESDDSEINDCFFTFDNSKYDDLLKRGEQKRAKRQAFGNTTNDAASFSNVKDILNEYNTASELHEQVDILHRAITQAAVTISEGADDKDKYNVEYNFVFDLIENLVMAIVNGILSPKVLLLLEVNQKIMGGTWEKFTLQDLLKAMRTIIVAIIKEVKDLIIQELLKLVLKQLEPIIAMLASILLREQLEAYADAIMEIIRNCPIIWFKFGSQKLDTKLDTVDYADIDVSSNKEGEQPSTNNC